MIAADLRLDGLRSDDVRALYRFVTEPPPESRIGDPRRGLVVFTRAGLPVALVETPSGTPALPAWLPRDRPVDAEALRRLRRERGATWALACGAGALERIDAVLARAVDPAAGPLALWLPVLEDLRNAPPGEQVLFSPAVLEGLPVPAASAVRAAFDFVLPDDSSALFFAFTPRGPSFGFVVEKRHGAIVRVAGPDALGVPVRGAMWKAAVPRLVAAARERIAPPAVGLFADEASLKRVVFGSEPSALPRALASRDVVLDPLPPWLALALGFDTAAKAVGTARDLLRRFDPLGLSDRLDVGRLAGRVQQRLGAELPFQRLLGFEPIALLARLHRWREL